MLDAHPEIPRTWSIHPGGERCTLAIPAREEQGFAITVEVTPREITFFGGGFHAHTLLNDGDPADFANHFAGLLYDLLTPLMRIREHRAGRGAHKWTLECLEEDGTWAAEGTMGLLFFNFFGRRSERFYQNTWLPVRENALFPPAREE